MSKKVNSSHSKEQLDKMRIKSIERMKEMAVEREEQYNTNPTLCKNCGKPLTYKQHIEGGLFCSRSCSTSYNNKQRSITKGNPSTDYKHCIYCGKLIKKTANRSWAEYNAKEYCSSKCRKQHYREQVIQEWKSGKYAEDKELPNIIREYLLEKAHFKCEQCGWHDVNPYTNKIPLEVHHVDGDPFNHNEDNLIVLCPNCHSLTETYCSGNLGNGRFNRRLSYAKRMNKLKI